MTHTENIINKRGKLLKYCLRKTTFSGYMFFFIFNDLKIEFFLTGDKRLNYRDKTYRLLMQMI